MMITNIKDWNQNKITLNSIKNLFQEKGDAANNTQVNAADVEVT